jgi:hypothetical protein
MQIKGARLTELFRPLHRDTMTTIQDNVPRVHRSAPYQLLINPVWPWEPSLDARHDPVQIDTLVQRRKELPDLGICPGLVYDGLLHRVHLEAYAACDRIVVQGM